jgi:hypothetical protein
VFCDMFWVQVYHLRGPHNAGFRTNDKLSLQVCAICSCSAAHVSGVWKVQYNLYKFVKTCVSKYDYNISYTVKYDLYEVKLLLLRLAVETSEHSVPRN